MVNVLNSAVKWLWLGNSMVPWPGTIGKRKIANPTTCSLKSEFHLHCCWALGCSKWCWFISDTTNHNISQYFTCEADCFPFFLMGRKNVWNSNPSLFTSSFYLASFTTTSFNHWRRGVPVAISGQILLTYHHWKLPHTSDDSSIWELQL